jgi:quinohemoprotein ethanol dehydrogenase
MAELIGAIKWRYNTQVGVIAAPVSFAIDGEQYIAVAAGWGGATGLAVRFDGRNQVPPSRILVFKLGANNTLPDGSNNFDLVAIPPRTIASSKELNDGLRLYAQHCTVCHGIAGISSKSIPDLRNLPIFFYENFNQVLLEGMMESAGMPSFNGVLTTQQVDNIYAYVIEEAHILCEESEPSMFDPIINIFYDILAQVIAWIEA